jgi:hypothetical protein
METRCFLPSFQKVWDVTFLWRVESALYRYIDGILHCLKEYGYRDRYQYYIYCSKIYSTCPCTAVQVGPFLATCFTHTHECIKYYY